MRVFVFKDKIIPREKAEKAFEEVFELYRKNAGIYPTLKMEDVDFSDLPVEFYEKNFLGIDKSYISRMTGQLKKRYGNGIDLVVFLVHQDNWKAIADSGVWGWNISKAFHGYEVEECRFDAKNNANNVGTLYHEIMHSHDSFIYRYLSVWIHKIIGVKNWDYSVVHGKENGYKFIRYKENQDALKSIGIYLKEAFRRRLLLYQKEIAVYKKLIKLLTSLAELLRRKIVLLKKKDEPLKVG